MKRTVLDELVDEMADTERAPRVATPCGHPHDVVCLDCFKLEPISTAQKRAAVLEADALGALWYGGEEGRARHDALWEESRRILREERRAYDRLVEIDRESDEEVCVEEEP